MSTPDGGTSSEATDLVIGLLTQVRVMNVGMEDLMYVLAMTRLRAAYVDLDPGIAKYMMAGPTRR